MLCRCADLDCGREGRSEKGETERRAIGATRVAKGSSTDRSLGLYYCRHVISDVLAFICAVWSV
jgi:hypothetical protein